MIVTRFAIEKNRITAVALVLILAAGYSAYLGLPRAEDPGFPIRSAQVITRLPGASPQRIEELVTEKIEKAVQEMPELKDVASTSKSGISIISVNIKDSYSREELPAIWDDLRKKVENVEDSLPDGIIKPVVNDEFGDVFGTIVAVTGEGYSYAELKDVADEVRDELLRIPDAAKVDIVGTQEERIFIEIDNLKLAQLGLSETQLRNILQARNIITAGGEVTAGEERLALEPTGSYETVDDIRRTLVPLPKGDVVRLRDIARIERSYVDPPRSLFRHNGRAGIALAISMRDGGNIIQLGEEVTTTLERLRPIYPIGVDLEPVVFQPKDVDKVVTDFVGNLGQAIVVVMLAMMLFLGVRTGLVVAALVPSAIGMALMFMQLFGIGLDQISLAALIMALGMLVDNGVVVAESTLVQIASGKSRPEAAIASAGELAVPLLVSSLTTSAAFLPIFLAESTVGEYTAPLFKVITITLLSSWVLSVTMTPLLCATFLKSGDSDENESYDSRFYVAYRALLGGLLKWRWITLGAVAAGFVGAMSLFSLVPKLFFPDSENPSFTVQFELPAGTPIGVTRAATSDVEAFMLKELKTNDERKRGVEHWATYIGEGGPRFYLGYVPEPSSPEFGIIVATGTDIEAVKEVVPKISEYMAENHPAVQANVRLRASGGTASAPIVYKLQGKDMTALFGRVETVKAQLDTVPGVRNVRDNWGRRIKKIVIDVSESRTRRAGLTHQDIAASLQTSLSGRVVTEFREGDNIIPVTLRSAGATRNDVGKLEDVSVFSQNNGQSVSLKQVADVELVWQPSKILRKDRLKTVEVRANLAPGATADSVNSQMVPWLTQESESWPASARWELGGDGQGSADANKAIADKLPIAGLIIILLLVAQFNSIRRPIIVLMTIPLALIGVVIGLLVMRSYFGFMTLLGIISLAGIVINNAIVLIDRIEIEKTEFGRGPVEAIIEAGQRRMRPILLTTFTTILGLIPLWYAGGPMWEPLAIAIMFGLLFSTILTLGVVPVLYAVLFRAKPSTT